MGVLACNLLRMLRQFYLLGEEVKRSNEWLIKRFIKVRARVAHHGRKWQVHMAPAFPLARHYRAVFGDRLRLRKRLTHRQRAYYSETQTKRGSVIDMMTVWPLSGRLRLPTDILLGLAKVF